jgi:hypothetical protein
MGSECTGAKYGRVDGATLINTPPQPSIRTQNAQPGAAPERLRVPQNWHLARRDGRPRAQKSIDIEPRTRLHRFVS